MGRALRVSLRLLGRALAAAALTGVFVVSFAAVFVLNGDTATTRRFVARTASGVLAQVFPGKLEVDDILHIGFRGIDIGHVRVIDTRGRPVIAARGLHVRASLPLVAKQLLFPDGQRVLTLPDIGVDEAEVILHKSPVGVSIAETFVDFSAPPSAPEPPNPGARPFVVDLPAIVLQHVHVMGGDGIGEALDVDLGHVPGQVHVIVGERVTVDVRRSSIKFRSVPPFSPHGTGEYHLLVDDKAKCRPWMQQHGVVEADLPTIVGVGGTACMFGHFDGDLGDVNITASGSMVDGVLAAKANIPRARPEEIAGLFPAMKIVEPMSLDAKLSGRIATPSFEADARLGPGSLHYGGNIVLAWPMILEGDFQIEDIDARTVSKTAPETSVDGNGHATVRLTDEGPDVNVALWTAPFLLADTAIPATRAYAHYDRRGVDGSFEVYEPGVALSGRVLVSPSNSVTLDADFAIPSFAAAPRVAGRVVGGVSGKVDARLDDGRLDLGFSGSGHGLGKGENIVGGAQFRGRLAGPVGSLRVEATIDGQKLALGGLAAESARVNFGGPVKGPYQTHLAVHDQRWSKLEGDASVGLFPAPSLQKVSVALESETLSGRASVASLAVEGGGVVLRGVDLEGTGVSAKGTVRLAPGASRIDLDGTADLAVLGRAALGDEIKRGTAKFALHTDEGPQRHAGSGHFSVEGLMFRQVPLVFSADGDLDVHGDAAQARMSGEAKLEDGTSLAVLTASADGSLSGPLTDPATWQRLSGTAGIDDLRLDVDKISEKAALLAKTLETLDIAVPKLPSMRGALHASARVSRTARTGPPDIALELRTQGFSSEAGPDGSPMLNWRGIDGRIAAFATKNPAVRAGDDQATRFGVELHLVDQKGALLDASLASELPANRLRDVTLSYLLDAGLPREELARLPLDASFSLAERPIAALPGAVRPEGLSGSVAAEIRVGGTLRAPSASYLLRTTELYAEGEHAPWPITAIVGGRVSDKSYDFSGGIVHGPTEVAQLGATGRFDLEEIALGRPGAVPPAQLWTSSGVLVLRGIQLDSIPGLAERRIAGRLSGVVSIKGLHDNPEINVDLDLLRGSALGGDFASAGLEARIVRGASSAHLRVEQQGAPGERGGTLDLSVQPTLAFREGLYPSLDRSESQGITLALKRFDVSPFASLAQPMLGDVGGLLDGTLSGSVEVAEKSARVSAIQGEVRWTEGSLLVPQIGQTFTGGQFVLSAARAENGEVQIGLRDISLDGSSGRVRAVASILIPERTISGWLVEGRRIRPDEETMRILASLRINERERIPVTFEGVALGDGYGAADMLLRLRGDRIEADVGIPELVFDLPESFSRKVQDLADPADIALVDKKYAAINRGPRERPVPIVIRIGLGDPLADLLAQTTDRRGYVIVRRSGLGVSLRGRTTLKIAREVEMEGLIETLGGRVNALGKPFEVEPGFIRFDGEATNPALALRARWDAPTGVRVYAEASGNLADMKLRLRSDPPRPEGDVLALVLFGRDQQAAATSANADASGSFAVGGGVATTLINSLLEPVQFFGRRIETRVDTSSSTNTKFGVATEIRPNLWAQVDLSTARQQLRLQNQDTSSLTLDWRFRPSWSLRTSVGDKGSSIVDLLWSFRY